MKLSDYVARALAERYGVEDIFLVSGGGIMHLLDSVGSQSGIRHHCVYHEQAAVVAAEGYARSTGRIGVVLATVGPGASNAASGLLGAWVDSIPVLVLVGQVRTDLIADYTKMRQSGPQEANTLGMARPITKYAASIRDPKEIRIELARAIHAATSGRPGPAWLEFPVDVSALDIDESELQGWTPEPEEYEDPRYVYRRAAEVAEILRGAKRPLVIPGNGVRSAGTTAALLALLRETGIPAVVPFTAKDLIHEEHPQYMGVFGSAGQRRANFAVQNADVLVGLGAGFNVQKTGFNTAGFAPNAKKVVIDIDPSQLTEQKLKPDIAVLADLRTFLPALAGVLRENPIVVSARWTNACADWKARYPIITPDYSEDSQHVNSYMFMDALSDAMGEGETLVTGNGLDVVSAYQAFRVKPQQRVFLSGWGSMGWDLPLSVGAAIGTGKRIILVTGDGSLQWNIQELLTIQHYGLPIKIFIFNNDGYSSIRATQNAFFDGRFVGAGRTSGVATPDFEKLAAAYGLGYSRIENNGQLAAGIRSFLGDPKSGFCELLLAPEQSVSPKASAFRRADGTLESRPLEDMAPFLPRREIHDIMHLFDEDAAD